MGRGTQRQDGVSERGQDFDRETKGFFFFFAVLVLKVKRRTEVQNPETLRGKDVVILREKS